MKTPKEKYDNSKKLLKESYQMLISATTKKTNIERRRVVAKATRRLKTAQALKRAIDKKSLIFAGSS